MAPASDTEDPLMEKQPPPSASLNAPVLGVFVPALVGVGVAELIYHLGKNDKIDKHLEQLE